MNKNKILITLVLMLVFSVAFVSAGCKTDQYKITQGYSQTWDNPGLEYSKWDGGQDFWFEYDDETGWGGTGYVNTSSQVTDPNGKVYPISTTKIEITCNGVCTVDEYYNGDLWRTYTVFSPEFVVGLFYHNIGCHCGGKISDPEDLTQCSIDKESIIHQKDSESESCSWTDVYGTTSCTASYSSNVMVGYCCSHKLAPCNSPTNNYVCNFNPNLPNPAPFGPNEDCNNIDTSGDTYNDACCPVPIGDAKKYIVPVGEVVERPLREEEIQLCAIYNEEECNNEETAIANCFWDGTGCKHNPEYICNKTSASKCVACTDETVGKDYGAGYGCCNGEVYLLPSGGGSKVCCGLTAGDYIDGNFVDCRVLKEFGPGKEICDACFKETCTDKCVDKNLIDPWSYVPSGFDRPPNCPDSGGIGSISSGLKFMDIMDIGKILGGEKAELSTYLHLQGRFMRLSDGYSFTFPILGDTRLCPSWSSKSVGATLFTKKELLPGVHTFGEFGVTQVERPWSKLFGTGEYDQNGYKTVTVTALGRTFTKLVPIWAERMGVDEGTTTINVPFVGLGASVGDPRQICGYGQFSGILSDECSGTAWEGGMQFGNCFNKDITLRIGYQDSSGAWKKNQAWVFSIGRDF